MWLIIIITANYSHQNTIQAYSNFLYSIMITRLHVVLWRHRNNDNTAWAYYQN